MDVSTVFEVFAFGVAGALGGSFLGVLVVRGPVQWGLEDIAEASPSPPAGPRSRCPTCKHTLRPRDLVPVASYFFLQGRCRDCGHSISRLYPTLEGLGAASGTVAALAFTTFGAAAIALIFFLFLIGLAAIDQRTGYLPDAMTLPLCLLGLLVSAWHVFVGPAAALAGALTGWGVFATLGVTYRLVRGREGLGGGDAKLFGAIGAFVGPTVLPIVAMAAAVTALVFVLMTRRSLASTDAIRFGPYLAAAGAAVLITTERMPTIIPGA